MNELAIGRNGGWVGYKLKDDQEHTVPLVYISAVVYIHYHPDIIVTTGQEQNRTSTAQHVESRRAGEHSFTRATIHVQSGNKDKSCKMVTLV